MPLVTTLKSDEYHLLQMCHVYIEIRMKFWALEDLKPICFFFVTDWFLGSRKYPKFPRLSNIYIFIYNCFGSLPQSIFQRYLLDRFSIHWHFGS